MRAPTHVQRLAGWVAELRLADVPAAVVERARAQRDSVRAAVAASGACDEATARVRAGLRDDGLYAAMAASMALDFDDYLLFGHTGHSAVLVPGSVGDETGAGDDARLVAQLAANEVGARLGGACLVGPLNGQLWSFVHAAGAALAAGRLLGLGPEPLAHALALSLWQAPRPTVPGFLAPDSKLLTAAEPALLGVRAARLAAAGVTGPLDVLDHSQGFLPAFAHAPLPGLLRGLGDGWATRTLCVKPYPGCAYVDTTIDALLGLGPPPATEVASVAVEAGILTCGMDAWSSGWAGRDPTPVTVTFSVPWNVAVTLVAGRLTPREVNAAWLRAHRTELAALAGRVTVRHDWALTARTAAALAKVLPPRLLARDAGRGRLLAGLAAMRREHRSLALGPRDAPAVLRLVRDAARTGGERFWDDGALAAFRMVFPARVRVRLRGGRELVAEADVPRGGAGNEAHPPERIAAEKRAAWPDGAARAARDR